MKGWGPKSSVCPSKPGKTLLFGWDIPGCCWDIPEVPEKFEKKKFCVQFSSPIVKYWRVPNPPGANPLVAERAPWRSSQSCVTGGQQPIGNPYRFLSFLLHTWQPLCDLNSQRKAVSATRELAPEGLGTRLKY